MKRKKAKEKVKMTECRILSTEQTNGKLGKSILGGMLFGTAGALMGARGKQYTYFYIAYSDGTATTERVENGSFMYRTYMACAAKLIQNGVM